MVADFSLTITLGVISEENRWVILYLAKKLATCLLAKLVLLSEMIVWGSQSDIYVLPEKLDNLLPADLREWHCLDSFGEVVSDYQ